ncbi:MAG: acyl-CoA reductase [Candidatus Riflebacteria bacterium]|nr:acyl-CoA reductase [Candidatus Riflebacteria bacterium]
MKKAKCLVFGQKVDSDWLNASTISEILAEAAEKAVLAAEPDIACILDILDQVSVAWADPDYHLRKKAAKILPELTMFSPEMIDEGFAVISAICRRKNVEKRLIGEFGDLSVLDHGMERPHLGFKLRARPRGVLLHLTAGNVFVGAVDSLVSGIITKNANILKMSRVDPVFPLLFIESIKEFDPAGIIWPNQAALLWKGGDTAIETPLLESPLTVVFWGGHEALQSLKKRVGPSTRLIENGPRYSFAVVEGSRIRKGVAPAMVRGLALDLCRWDQQACSSPHVVYVIDKDYKSAHLLIEALYDELVQMRDELPLGNLNFDEKVEIRKVRELARMSQARGEGRLVCPEDFSFTLVLEYDSAFKVSCLNRTLFIKIVADVDALVEQVKPLSAYLQSAGVYCEPAIGQALEAELLAIGVKRITEIGGMSEGHDGAPHEGAFLLRQLVEWVDVETRDNPASRVEWLLKSIQASPYYHDVIAKAGGCGFEHFHKLPLLDRETFYRHSPPESAAILTGPMTDAYVYASGGTTGNPKFTFYSNDEYRYVTDVLTDIYRNAGLCPGDRVANLFIAGNLWTSFNVAGRALENLGCLNLPVGGASDIENILKYLQIFAVNAVVGLPSIIINLAEEIKRRGLKVRIEKILYGGEHLRPQTCDFLREAVGASTIRSAGYACVDTGPVGWQCLHLEGSIHHVLEEYCHAEILNTADLEPVTGNEAGEIVATNLNRILMPVVRYRTGDLGRWVDLGPCACGFNGRSFELLGRCDDLLVIGGINLMPADVAAGLAGLPVSQSFQIAAQTGGGRDQLCLRLEADKSLPDKTVIEALKKGSYKIAESLAENWMNIVIEWHKPGSIKRNSRTGKLKPVVDERFSPKT